MVVKCNILGKLIFDIFTIYKKKIPVFNNVQSVILLIRMCVNRGPIETTQWAQSSYKDVLLAARGI